MTDCGAMIGRTRREDELTSRQPDIERFHKLLDDGKPALIFAAHLANWELPAICATTYKLDSAVLYRRPNIASIDRWLTETRTANMGELISTDLDAPVKISEALERGAHVGMLVDQYYMPRRPGHLLRPTNAGKPAAGSARAPFRLPYPRHAHRAAGRTIDSAPS